VVERSRGVGYRWVPVDSLGKWKLGVEGRWKEGRTYAHCWAGLTASLECVRWTRATLPVSDSWRQSARRASSCRSSWFIFDGCGMGAD